MERPNTVLGLAAYYARSRWAQLGGRGRIAAVVLGIAVIGGLKLAIFGACGSACGMERAHHAALAAEAAAHGEGASDCPHSH